MALSPISSSQFDLSVQREMEQMARLNKEQQVDSVSKQFEGVLLRDFLNKSLEPMFEGYLNEKGSTNDMYRYFVVDTLANEMSEAEVFGFSNALQAQLMDLSVNTKEDALNE